MSAFSQESKVGPADSRPGATVAAPRLSQFSVSRGQARACTRARRQGSGGKDVAAAQPARLDSGRGFPDRAEEPKARLSSVARVHQLRPPPASDAQRSPPSVQVSVTPRRSVAACLLSRDRLFALDLRHFLHFRAEFAITPEAST